MSAPETVVGSDAAPAGTGRLASPGVVLGVVAAAGVAVDAGVRSGVASVGGALAVVVVAGGLTAARRPTGRHAAGLLGCAVVLGGWLAVRQSPWVVLPMLAAAGGLLVLAAATRPGASVLDLTPVVVTLRVLDVARHAAAAPRLVAARLPWRDASGDAAADDRRAAVLRGVALAAPVTAVLVALLASADAVFASFLRLPTSPASIAGHVVLVGLGAWGMATLVHQASHHGTAAPPPVPAILGHVEALVVLGGLVSVYAAFAVAQAVTLLGGARTVLDTAGLTYAEHARSGFFQLLAAAALTLVVLLALRAFTAPTAGRSARAHTALSELAVALTLVVVVVAVRRLQVYEQAFGLTMLRLYSTAFAVWVGGVFVLLGAALARRRERPWLTPAAGALGLAVLLSLAVADPEAVVARHNVAHAERTGRFDAVYLAGLSDDAVPPLLEALPRLQDDDRLAVLRGVCSRPAAGGGPLAWNLSRHRAARARRLHCPSTTV